MLNGIFGGTPARRLSMMFFLVLGACTDPAPAAVDAVVAVDRPDVAAMDRAPLQDNAPPPPDVPVIADASDVPASAAPIEVRGMAARVIANGATYMETVLDGIPPYSMSAVTLTITNISRSPVMIESVALDPVAPAEAYEWVFTTPGNPDRVPYTFMPQSVAAGAGVPVGLHFVPIASGPRNVRFVVRYGGGQTYTITVAGRGRDNLAFSPNVSNALERLFGRGNVMSSNGIQPGAVVADAAGNVYFNVNATQWSDRFSDNIVLARVNADGRAAWVRELNEPFSQESYDIGNNGQVGGNPDTLDIDASGGLYTTFRRSLSVSNNAFQAAAMRVNANTGDIVWATGLTNSVEAIPTLGTQGMDGQAIDATLSDRVIVAGSFGAGGVFLSALNKSDGAVVWTRVVNHSGIHRVGALAVGADGAAYLGGIANNTPFMLRVNGVNGATPSVAWMRSMAVFGSNVRGLVVSGDGVLAAINVAGADTSFVGARFLGADGSVVWARVWRGGPGSINNTMAVALHNGQAVFAGRIAVVGFDASRGDGFLASLNPMTGAWNWGSVYYTGRGAEELTQHHITGLFSTSAGLWVIHQGVPGAGNGNHFWGRWYQAIDDTMAFPGGTGSMRLMPYTVMTTSVMPITTTPTTVVPHPFSPTAAMTWLDQASTVTCDDPVRTEAMGFRTGTHVLLQRVTVR